jgi:hypothetical protein
MARAPRVHASRSTSATWVATPGRAPANDAVLIAVSPDQHAIEVVYGSAVRGRGAESAAPLGVAAAAASFNYNNLIGGLISAVRVTSAGISPA